MEVDYKYCLYTWGGFYNSEYLSKHKYYKKGLHVFNTQEERQNLIDYLKDLEEKFQAKHLAMQIWEGYDALNLPVCHRVVEYKGKRIYSKSNWHFPAEITVLEYHMEYKWYPGFNDEEVDNIFPDEDVDYSKVKIISEWITGSFNIN